MKTDKFHRAFVRAATKLRRDPAMTAAATSVGVDYEPGGKRGARTGYQVFVKVCRFSEARLKRRPNTGGLFVAP